MLYLSEKNCQKKEEKKKHISKLVVEIKKKRHIVLEK